MQGSSPDLCGREEFCKIADESKYRLSDLLHAKGDRLRYLYDFGDSWEHDVRLEKIIPVAKRSCASCLAAERAGPPEDCGGVPGYYNLVQAMGDPCHRDRHGLIEWLGEEFNPEAVDLEDIHSRMKMISPHSSLTGSGATFWSNFNSGS